MPPAYQQLAPPLPAQSALSIVEIFMKGCLKSILGVTRSASTLTFLGAVGTFFVSREFQELQ